MLRAEPLVSFLIAKSKPKSSIPVGLSLTLCPVQDPGRGLCHTARSAKAPGLASLGVRLLKPLVLLLFPI